VTLTATPPVTAPDPAPRGRRGTMPLLVRMHFYAGVLVAPFLVVAALTGLAYSLTPQLDRVVHGDVLRVDPGTTAVPVSEQVAAAQATVPDLSLSSVRLHEDPALATRVTFDDPTLVDDRQRSVYVDPWTGEVTGELVTWFGYTPTMTLFDDLHRNLLLGDLGRHYSELAASWLWVLALGGLVLWLRRRRADKRLRRTLLPETSARGRRRVLSWHATVGLSCVLGLLFLSATGLTWSRYAGERFSEALVSLDATNPGLDTALPAGATAASVAVEDADTVLATARDAGLDGPLELGVPVDGGAWSATQVDEVWPVRQDAVAVDPLAGEVTATNAWADRPLLSKLSTLGISAHMGILFGPLNQVLLATLALGVLLVVFWGYRAWWQRRPLRRDGATVRSRPVGRLPQRGTWREVHPVVLVLSVAATAFVAWAMPVLGVTLVAFLVLDAVLGLVARRRRRSDRDLVLPTQREDPAEQLLV
jgi:uncharacterized iron-regulated membrane protein